MSKEDPHPIPMKGQSIETPWSPGDDPMLHMLRKELHEVYRSIDLNYGRLTYKKPIIKTTLLFIKDVLTYCIQLLDDLKEEKEDKKTFSVNKNNI